MTMPKNKVFGLGIDGAPYTLLMDLMKRGVMPNLAGLCRDGGTLCPMDTSIPEISAIAWTNLYTGKDPGAHGLYGFVDLRPGTYKMFFPNAQSVKAPAIWDDLAWRGKRSIVINMPSTYPAREVNGILVAGFVAISLEKAVYPPALIPELKELGYQIDVDTMAARRDVSVLPADLIKTLEARIALVDKLWNEQDWDFFSPVITGTDRLHHFLWSAYQEEDHPYKEFFFDYYARIDDFIGRIARRIDDQTTLMMYSDHGFCAIEQEVHLNYWLAEEGYLSFTTDKPEGFEDLAPSSRAFCLDPSRIYIHTQGRWPNGCVQPGKEREELIEEIIGKAKAIVGTDGRPIIERAFRKEEIYHGPQIGHAPDIVFISRRGYDLKGALGRPALFGRSPLTGMHTQDDAMFFINRSFDTSRKMEITRIKQLILDHVG